MVVSDSVVDYHRNNTMSQGSSRTLDAATCPSGIPLHEEPSTKLHNYVHPHQNHIRQRHSTSYAEKSSQLTTNYQRGSGWTKNRHRMNPTSMTTTQINQITTTTRSQRRGITSPATVGLFIFLSLFSLNHITSIHSQEPNYQQQHPPSRPYRLNNNNPPPPSSYWPSSARSQQATASAGSGAQQAAGNPAIVPQVWARGLVPEYQDESLRDHHQAQNDQSLATIVRRNSNKMLTGTTTTAALTNNNNSNNNMMKSVRHIVTNSPAAQLKSNTTQTTTNDDICSDRLCYGLPMGCLGGSGGAGSSSSAATTSMVPSHAEQSGSLCSVLVTSKRFIDPNRPFSRDILFELIALPVPEISNYAAVGFSETGRMQGLVSECLQYRDAKTQLQIIKLKHSYNTPGMYSNVPAIILSGIKNLGVSYENGYYQCRWIVESAVEFSYEASNGSIITRREDLGHKNYHILLASGEYNEITDVKNIHMDRISSLAPVSLAQTGHIKSLGSHILIRIHGSLMIAIWVGLVTLSIVLARYYKREWSNSKISDLAIWFVVHRTLMLASWFGSIMAVIFAYMYTETYHPGLHQISGTTCLVLTSVQILGGLFRPSQESTKRIYFNWLHFICGNLSYLFARNLKATDTNINSPTIIYHHPPVICLITAAFLAPAHLPPLYIWVIVIFVGIYALTHVTMTIHQYIVHKSSKISITPMSDLNSNSSSTYTSCGFVADSYPKEINSPFRQFMLGIFVTILVIFIVLLISLVNIK